METCKFLSVSQLNGYIKSVFDDELILHNIGIFGELSQLSVRENVSYFTITEGGCYINCVMFSSVENIEIGSLVKVYGSVTFYPKSGKTNFGAKSISVYGKGELNAELNKLKERLKSEGLFENRKKPPVYIARAAVITSEAGAVIHDIMSVIRDRGAKLELKLFPSSVQGNSAEKSIVDALNKANDENFDVIVIARGGGSNYDLDVFNSEKLARAVANSCTPVISAVGHETDYTLCDFCAGTRAGTPSIAAAIISDINLEFSARFRQALQTIDSGIERLYLQRSSRIYRSSATVVHSMDKKLQRYSFDVRTATNRMSVGLKEIVSENLSRILQVSESVRRKVEDIYSQTDIRFKTCSAALEHSSPLKTLSRGFAKVISKNKTVNGISDISAGDDVRIVFADGSAKAEITEIERTGKNHGSRRKP